MPKSEENQSLDPLCGIPLPQAGTVWRATTISSGRDSHSCRSSGIHHRSHRRAVSYQPTLGSTYIISQRDWRRPRRDLELPIPASATFCFNAFLQKLSGSRPSANAPRSWRGRRRDRRYRRADRLDRAASAVGPTSRSPIP